MIGKMHDSPTARRRKRLAVAAFAVVALNSMFILATATSVGRSYGLRYFGAFGLAPIAFILASLWILVEVGKTKRST